MRPWHIAPMHPSLAWHHCTFTRIIFLTLHKHVTVRVHCRQIESIRVTVPRYFVSDTVSFHPTTSPAMPSPIVLDARHTTTVLYIFLLLSQQTETRGLRIPLYPAIWAATCPSLWPSNTVVRERR